MDYNRLKEEKEMLTKKSLECKVAPDTDKNVATKTKALDCISERGNKNRCIVKEKKT
jgi:hypothetical protein